jgi:NAD(P)H-flavin reductase
VEVEVEEDLTFEPLAQQNVESRTDTELSTSKQSIRQITLKLRFPGTIDVKAGQCAIIYMPGLSGLHGYRLPITWWSHDQSRMSMDFIVEPHSELAKRLSKKKTPFSRGYFTGPHGLATDMNDFGSVLLVATGYGIAAQLPHVKELIDNRDNGYSCNRQIHLIWQFETWGMCVNKLMKLEN